MLTDFAFILSAVLQNIWSLQTQCFHSSGGSLGSTGYLQVVKLWHVILLCFTGQSLSFSFLVQFLMSVSLWNPNFCNVTCCRLCIIFLGFDVFFVVFCVALACIIGIAVCCCLPCIIAILYAVADQVAFFYSHHVIPVVFIVLTYNINNFVIVGSNIFIGLQAQKYCPDIIIFNDSLFRSFHMHVHWIVGSNILSKYYNLQCLSLSHSLTLSLHI